MKEQHAKNEFQVGEIQPNPFRDLERYPLRPDKITALRESVRKTGYWENLEARLGSEGPQLAYGHHRLEALRREYGSEWRIRLTIRDLDDEAMLQRMIQENREDWNASALEEHQVISGVIKAYAEGRTILPRPSRKTKKSELRYAPSFTRGDDPNAQSDHPRPYTATTLAGYLGWHARKVQQILVTLELVEADLLEESILAPLSPSQALAIAHAIRTAWTGLQEQAKALAEDDENAEAKEEAERVLLEGSSRIRRASWRAAQKMASGHWSTRDAPDNFNRLLNPPRTSLLLEAPAEPGRAEAYAESIEEFLKALDTARPGVPQFSVEVMVDLNNRHAEIRENLNEMEAEFRRSRNRSRDGLLRYVS